LVSPIGIPKNQRRNRRQFHFSSFPSCHLSSLVAPLVSPIGISAMPPRSGGTRFSQFCLVSLCRWIGVGRRGLPSASLSCRYLPGIARVSPRGQRHCSTSPTVPCPPAVIFSRGFTPSLLRCAGLPHLPALRRRCRGRSSVQGGATPSLPCLLVPARPACSRSPRSRATLAPLLLCLFLRLLLLAPPLRPSLHEHAPWLPCPEVKCCKTKRLGLSPTPMRQILLLATFSRSCVRLTGHF